MKVTVFFLLFFCLSLMPYGTSVIKCALVTKLSSKIEFSFRPKKSLSIFFTMSIHMKPIPDNNRYITRQEKSKLDEIVWNLSMRFGVFAQTRGVLECTNLTCPCYGKSLSKLVCKNSSCGKKISECECPIFRPQIIVKKKNPVTICMHHLIFM